MKKLNSKGITHLVTMLAVVSLVAIAGVAYLVGSHADSCNPKAGTCSVADQAATSDSTITYAISCTMGNIPKNYKLGTVIKPSVKFTNSSNRKIAVDAVGNIISYGDTGTTSKGGPVKAVVPAHKSVTKVTGLQYTVAKSSSSAHAIQFGVNGAIGAKTSFECDKVIKLPS